MNVSVTILHEPKRKRPYLVRWWGEPDPETGKQRRYSVSFMTQSEAKAFQAEKLASLNRGQPRDPVNVSLEELVEDFTEARLSQLSYASRIGYENTIEQMLSHFGRATSIRHIDRRRAEAFIASRKRRDGRPGDLSSWSRARHLIHARAIFAAAVAWGYVDENSFRADRLHGRSALNVNPKAKPWHHLTPDEFVRLLSVVTDERRRAAYWLMYGCGLRPGEAYNLRAANIDLKHRRIHVVNRAATAELPPFTVKAEGQSSASKERTIPIPGAAIPDLTASMKESFKSGGFVVISPERFLVVQTNWQLCREGKPWAGHSHRPWQNRDMVNNMLRNTKSLLEKAGLTLTAPFTLHTFRKSFAQNHADAGTPPRTLAMLLGHADTRVTMQYYSRVTDANERAAGDTMDRLLNESRGSAHVG